MNFKGKEIQFLSTHAFMLTKVLADDFFYPEGHFNPPTSRVVSFFYFEERKQSYNVAQSNIILPTLSHKPLLHFEEKKLKRAKANEERREREPRRRRMAECR